MIEISILDSIAQSFFIYLGVIVVYNYFFSKASVKTIVKSMILLCIFSLIGCALDDLASVLFFIYIVRLVLVDLVYSIH